MFTILQAEVDTLIELVASLKSERNLYSLHLQRLLHLLRSHDIHVPDDMVPARLDAGAAGDLCNDSHAGTGDIRTQTHEGGHSALPERKANSDMHTRKPSTVITYMSSLSEHGYGSLTTGQGSSRHFGTNTKGSPRHFSTVTKGSPRHLVNGTKDSPRHMVYTLGSDNKGRLTPLITATTNILDQQAQTDSLSQLPSRQCSPSSTNPCPPSLIGQHLPSTMQGCLPALVPQSQPLHVSCHMMQEQGDILQYLAEYLPQYLEDGVPQYLGGDSKHFGPSSQQYIADSSTLQPTNGSTDFPRILNSTDTLNNTGKGGSHRYEVLELANIEDKTYSPNCYRKKVFLHHAMEDSDQRDKANFILFI